MRNTVAATLLAALVCLAPAVARAQGFDAEIFRPATSTSGYFSQEKARILGRGDIDAGLTLDFAHNPLVLRDAVTNEIVDNGAVVANRLVGHLGIALGLVDWLELRARLPVVLYQGGDVDLVSPQNKLKATTLGDLEFFAKGRLVGKPADDGFHLALALGFSVPSGSASNFSGDGSVAARPRLVAGYESARLSLAANAGYNVRRKSNLGSVNITVDDELAGGLGGAYAVAPDSLWLLAEAYVTRGVHGATVRDTPTEAIAGARYALPGPWMLQGGVGVGLTSGVGSPAVRGLLMLAYASDMHHAMIVRPLEQPEGTAPPPKPAAPRDSDGDGIVDAADKCPNDPEDKDGFEDSDGCPDPDNDKDGVPDTADKCPNDPEDKDGFEDSDGCPDPDNDKDGIPDTADKCPNEPEVFNGIEDDDGCPDKGTALAIMKGERIEIHEQVNFATNKAIIQQSSFPLLATVAKLLALHPEVLKLRIEGHTDRSGNANKNLKLSQDRAEAVRQHLIERGGIDGGRLDAVGFGATKPIATNGTKKGRALNRRSEFIIVERTGGSAAPASEPPPR
ncbi:MAG TPA: OmpA family protein [Polyangia bacterium]|jgi:outer membrane protein OmpA-like peptidoglycan-associated protein